MAIPQNPQTIILQNEYYPNGLKEIDIWNYYQKNKNLILRQIIGREVMIFFATDINKTVVIRNIKGTPIRITPSTYDTIISGRTLAIYSTMKRIEEFGIVDIDISDFDVAKRSAQEVYDEMLKAPFIRDIKIRYTGKESFHIVCYFKRSLYIDRARLLLKEYLKESNLSNDYDIEHKRRKGIPNLDLSPNKQRGAFITLGSLSSLGLKCVEVDIRRIKTFRKESAII